jgi:chitin synthase
MVALQVILALGNRPKGERLMYTISFAIFGALALYLILNTVYLTVMAFCPLSSLISAGQAQGQSTIQTLLGGQTGFLTILAGLIVSRPLFSTSLP